MKVKVIKEFVDIHTGELHTVGSSFDCGHRRYDEIKASGNYVEPVAEKTAEKSTKKENFAK